MKFAKATLLIAGVYGLIVLLPQYFLEAKIGRDSPAPITHPEFYYGFIGVTIAWQSSSSSFPGIQSSNVGAWKFRVEIIS